MIYIITIRTNASQYSAEQQVHSQSARRILYQFLMTPLLQEGQATTRRVKRVTQVNSYPMAT